MEDWKETITNREIKELLKQEENDTNTLWSYENIMAQMEKLEEDDPYRKNIHKLIKLIKSLKKEKKEIREKITQLQSKCQHTFKFDGESYGGNYDIYRCKKCGQVTWTKN
jgi:rubrerythrin